MKNHFFKMAIFCLISNVTCSMGSIKLDKESEDNLLKYILRLSSKNEFWPIGANVTLESFRCVDEEAGNKNGKELEYEARFCGRYPEIGLYDGRICPLVMCKKVNACILATTLKNNGVIVPEQK